MAETEKDNKKIFEHIKLEIDPIVQQLIRSAELDKKTEADPVRKLEQSPTLTEGGIKNELNTTATEVTANSKADNASSTVDDKNKNKKSPEEIEQDEIEKRRNNLGSNQKAADSKANGGNEDGIVNGTEDKKVEELDKKDREAVENVMKAMVIAGGGHEMFKQASDGQGNNYTIPFNADPSVRHK